MARRSQKAALTDMFAVYYSVNVTSSSRCHKRSTPPGPRREVCGCFADVSASLGLAAVLDVSLTQKRLLRSDVAGFCRFLFFSLCLSPVEGQDHGREPAGASRRHRRRAGAGSPAPPGAAFGVASAVTSRGRAYSETRGPGIEPNEQHTLIPGVAQPAEQRPSWGGRSGAAGALRDKELGPLRVPPRPLPPALRPKGPGAPPPSWVTPQTRCHPSAAGQQVTRERWGMLLSERGIPFQN